MSTRKTFEEYQEEYRRAIAQRDREDEELLMKLTEEANQYKADFDQKIKSDNKKTYEDSKRKQVELYEKLSSTSDLKTWERILNMCDIEHPPENTDLSTLVDVMKKMDSRVTEKPEPEPIKRGEVRFEEDAPSPVSGSTSSKSANASSKNNEHGGDGGLFDFTDDDFVSRSPPPKEEEKHEEKETPVETLEEKHEESNKAEEEEKEIASNQTSPVEENQKNANGALDDLFGFNGEEKNDDFETQNNVVEENKDNENNEKEKKEVKEEEAENDKQEEEQEEEEQQQQQQQPVIEENNTNGSGDDFEDMFD